MDPFGDVRWKLWAEAFRAWVPIVVSVCAISLTVFQAAATRRHARLSVQPRLDWHVEQDSGAGTIILRLVNVGFGPAVIDRVALSFDGEDLGPPEKACPELDRRLGREGDAWDTGCAAISGDLVLPAGDSVILYASRPAAQAAGHRAEPIDAAKLTVDARYCSFYEECWQLRAQ
jgi:hypothetical protein